MHFYPHLLQIAASPRIHVHPELMFPHFLTIRSVGSFKAKFTGALSSTDSAEYENFLKRIPCRSPGLHKHFDHRLARMSAASSQGQSKAEYKARDPGREGPGQDYRHTKEQRPRRQSGVSTEPAKWLIG